MPCRLTHNFTLYQNLLLIALLLTSCDLKPLNNPYPEAQYNQNILYQSFDERPKHLDPAVAYSENEYAFIAQIYEPPYQYHYLKRPYELIPLTAQTLPEIRYLDKMGQPLAKDAGPETIAFSDYLITIKPGIFYQPHPALAKTGVGDYSYHHLSPEQIEAVSTLTDFEQTGSREVTAEDYVYQIKRMAHPKTQSPIAEMMKGYIAGFAEFAGNVKMLPKTAIKDIPLQGATAISRYQYRVRINGKYPQFMYWLAMTFFAPMPWEADVFYNQPGLAEKNITLDWYPLGTGAYRLTENNPNRRMVLEKNPNFHSETYPSEGEPEDSRNGLLIDAGKSMPFIEKVIFTLEKETIPRWSKFLQGYFDASGIASDSFDQAIQFTGGSAELTPSMRSKNIQLQTSIEPSIFYMGFNMLDSTVGGISERARKLRQAISIAVDYEELITIFRNGRGIPAQGVLPPGIFGFAEGKTGINPYVYDWINGKPQRKPLSKARQLMSEAGYTNGIDPQTSEPLILYFDTTSMSIDDRPMFNWYRKQFEKLGIKLIIRATDYNRFQDKIRKGNAQIYVWGWNADYPDPENFFFLLYGGNAKVKSGGENSSNYANPEFDRLFEQMRNQDNSPERLELIQRMQDIVRHDAPWLFGLHPKQFSLFHSWFLNRKPHVIANNTLKYLRIDAEFRAQQRQAWNSPVIWPVFVFGVAIAAGMAYAVYAFRNRTRKTLQ